MSAFVGRFLLTLTDRYGFQGSCFGKYFASYLLGVAVKGSITPFCVGNSTNRDPIFAATEDHSRLALGEDRKNGRTIRIDPNATAFQPLNLDKPRTEPECRFQSGDTKISPHEQTAKSCIATRTEVSKCPTINETVRKIS